MIDNEKPQQGGTGNQGNQGSQSGQQSTNDQSGQQGGYTSGNTSLRDDYERRNDQNADGINKKSKG